MRAFCPSQRPVNAHCAARLWAHAHRQAPEVNRDFQPLVGWRRCPRPVGQSCAASGPGKGSAVRHSTLRCLRHVGKPIRVVPSPAGCGRDHEDRAGEQIWPGSSAFRVRGRCGEAPVDAPLLRFKGLPWHPPAPSGPVSDVPGFLSCAAISAAQSQNVPGVRFRLTPVRPAAPGSHRPPALSLSIAICCLF